MSKIELKLTNILQTIKKYEYCTVSKMSGEVFVINGNEMPVYYLGKTFKIAERRLKDLSPKYMYKVWNGVKKEYQFGICEDTYKKAEKKLYDKIGKDSYKYRFVIKEVIDGRL